MHRWLRLGGAAAATWTVACAVGVSGGGGEDRAMTLRVAEPAFGSPQILSTRSLPPQFTVVMTREMPTPGWRFEIDAVDVDPEAGRIVARISEIAPEGLSAQVITQTACRVALGAIDAGTWLLELRLRRGTTGEYRPVQAIVLHASG